MLQFGTVYPLYEAHAVLTLEDNVQFLHEELADEVEL